MKKPLHVQVAEALGTMSVPWAEAQEIGYDPDYYDTDWEATGPLIEKYGFWLRRLDGVVVKWDAFRNDDLPTPRGEGDTALEAVCRLILALHKAGELVR